MKALVWAMMLLVLILYITAIFMTKLIGHSDQLGSHEKVELYFGSMAASMFGFAAMLSSMVRWYASAGFLFPRIGTLHIVNVGLRRP